MPLGLPELLVILVIVILLFGVGRLSKIGSELGKGISAFRTGLNEGKPNDVQEISTTEPSKREGEG